MAGELCIGTSDWTYRDWLGVLYEPGCPQRRWFERYAESFDAVELDTRFYLLPSAEQFATMAAGAAPRYSATIAPFSSSRARNPPTSRSGGSIPARTASAAAVPAASPVAIHAGISLVAWCTL